MGCGIGWEGTCTCTKRYWCGQRASRVNAVKIVVQARRPAKKALHTRTTVTMAEKAGKKEVKKETGLKMTAKKVRRLEARGGVRWRRALMHTSCA